MFYTAKVNFFDKKEYKYIYTKNTYIHIYIYVLLITMIQQIIKR